MQNLIKTFPCVLLLACASKPTVMDTQYNSIQNQIESVKESLPDECLTPGVKSQLIAIEYQIIAQRTACDSAVNAEKKLKDMWMVGAYALAVLIVFLITKRI